MVVQSLENLEILEKSGNKILVRENLDNLEKSGNFTEKNKNAIGNNAFGPPTFGRKGSYKITPVVS